MLSNAGYSNKDIFFVCISQREVAVLKYQDLTEPLEREEAQALAQLEENQAKQKELEYHKVRFLWLVVYCLRRKKHNRY